MCPPMVTRTHKGVYTWPATRANTKMSQKCSSSSSSRSNTTNETTSQVDDVDVDSSSSVVFECMSDAKWSRYIDVAACSFESKLTRFLHNESSLPASAGNLEQLIHSLVAIHAPITSMYDVSFMQRLMLNNVQQQRQRQQRLRWRHNATAIGGGEVTKTSRVAWRRQLMWLNDVLAKLDERHVLGAQQLDASLFAAYFFDVLVATALRQQHPPTPSQPTSIDPTDDYDGIIEEEMDQEGAVGGDDSNDDDEDDVDINSSYVASLPLGATLKRFASSLSLSLSSSARRQPSSNKPTTTTTSVQPRLVCTLDAYNLTHQLYFNCRPVTSSSSSSESVLTLRTRLEFNMSTTTPLATTRQQTATLLVFDNGKLFPHLSKITIPNGFYTYDEEQQQQQQQQQQQKKQCVDDNALLLAPETWPGAANGQPCAQILGLMPGSLSTPPQAASPSRQPSPPHRSPSSRQQHKYANIIIVIIIVTLRSSLLDLEANNKEILIIIFKITQFRRLLFLYLFDAGFILTTTKRRDYKTNLVLFVLVCDSTVCVFLKQWQQSYVIVIVIVTATTAVVELQCDTRGACAAAGAQSDRACRRASAARASSHRFGQQQHQQQLVTAS